MESIQQPNRPPRYWRRHHPDVAVDRRTARILREIADVHPDWNDEQVLAWWNYTGEPYRGHMPVNAISEAADDWTARKLWLPDNEPPLAPTDRPADPDVAWRAGWVAGRHDERLNSRVVWGIYEDVGGGGEDLLRVCAGEERAQAEIRALAIDRPDEALYVKQIPVVA